MVFMANTSPPPDARRRRRANATPALPADPPASTVRPRPRTLAEQRAAYELAARVGCNATTALRAILFGADVVRTRAIREALAPLVDEYRTRLSA